MLQEQGSVQGISQDAPRAQTAEYGARKAGVFDDMASHFPAVTLDDAVDYVAEEGFVVAEEVAGGAGGMEGVMRGWAASVGVEVKLVNLRAGGAT